jgi:predicted phage tail protein
MSDDLTQNLPTSRDAALAQILSAVQSLGATVQNLGERLARLEQKVEEGHETLSIETKSMRAELRNANRKISVINDNLIQTQVEYLAIDDRAHDVERLRA